MTIKRIVQLFSKVVKHDFRFVQVIRYSDKFPRDSASTEATAGILIIGDEILSGTPDVNTLFLINELKEMKIKVRKVAIVPDNVDDIVNEVCELSSKCSFVLTTGGIGPTHDDVTYEAVAKAFNEKLQLNECLFKLLLNYFGPDYAGNPGVLKYSHIPKSSDLNIIDFYHNSKKIKYPIVSVRNVYIFPGVPGILQKSFKVFKNKFVVQTPMKFTKAIYINVDEFSVIEVLNEAVKTFKNVKFGSYPTFSDNYYKVKLTMEGRFLDEIENACMFFSDKLPTGSIMSLKKNILLSAKHDV